MNKFFLLAFKFALALATLLILGIALLLYIAEGGLQPELPFDRAEWMNGTDENQMYFPRLRMADDLIDNNTLDGKTRDEVLSMLGEPMMTDVTWSPRDHFGLLYHLGPERGWVSVDSEWLGIKFDTNGTVSECKIVRD